MASQPVPADGLGLSGTAPQPVESLPPMELTVCCPA